VNDVTLLSRSAPPTRGVHTLLRRAVLALSIAAALAPASAAAQAADRAAGGWNDERSRALVERATERRARELADTALADYRARAHGYLTFLAQLGEGFPEPPKVVKADELAVEVLWRAPDMSKQRVVGRRDTLLLPADIGYYRDRFGIVQNNFPDAIRMGEGRDVRDVPHPLSDVGLAEYDFAIRDSLTIRLPNGAIDVYEVRVRPKDEDQPRVVGALYIERGSAQVARMALTFTRAALLDKRIETLSVTLENGLVEGRFWLPRHQEIEVVRTSTWLDYPARGIIRGRWEVCCYEVNVGLDPALFRGPEIVQAPSRVLRQHEWEGEIFDGLPEDVRAVTDEDVRAVQEEAQEIVRARALSRARGGAISARRISDFVRVNRVEGLAAGAGAMLRLGAGTSLSARGRWGFSDHEGKGRLSLAKRWASGVGLELFAEREYRDAGDVLEVSPVRNSLAAQEFGSDYTDPYDVRAAGAGVDLGPFLGMRWRVEGAYEAQEALRVNARPASGRYERTIPAWPIDVVRFSLLGERSTSAGPFGTTLRWSTEARAGAVSGRDTSLDASEPAFVRLRLDASAERPFGRSQLVLRSVIGAVDGAPAAPPQQYVFFGGPTSGPGYRYHEFAGQFAASQRVEWRAPVPFVAIPLGRYGRAPATATLAPFAHAVYVGRPAAFQPLRSGWYPAVGVGALFLFDLLRVDVARGLRDGRWTFSVDLSRDLWGIL
jgi:hypothetical protein